MAERVRQAQLAFHPGEEKAQPELLGRFIPPVDAGLGAAALSAETPPGSWVLDPFGLAPSLAVEAAQAGYRVLVAASHPIVQLMLELAAQPPSYAAMQATWADLAVLRRGDERLEGYLESLYASACERCGAPLAADAFLWERDASGPYAKLVNCAACGFQGEQATAAEDRQGRVAVGRSGPHHGRALERVVAWDDPDRAFVEEALDLYPSAAWAGLMTVINKLNGLSAQQAPRAMALLLAAFDRTNLLWPVGSGRERPRQLSVPPRYYEYSVAAALDGAVELWCRDNAPVAIPFTRWPEVPPESGGICLYPGRLREFARAAPEWRAAAALTALPRPNAAYWAFMALWAGWLWGQAAAAPFIRALRRRRYDWAWHSQALASGLREAKALLPVGAPLWAVMPEAEPAFLNAAYAAGGEAGLQLDGLAIQPQTAQAQWLWRTAEAARCFPTALLAESELIDWVARGGQEVLQARGEPSELNVVLGGALRKLADQPRADPAALPPIDADPSLYERLNRALPEAFSYRHGFLRFNAAESDLASGWWWLRDPSQADSTTLADRVEQAAVNYLQRHPGSGERDLAAALYRRFRGGLTFAPDLLTAILASYGEQQDGAWRLRPENAPSKRRRDLAAIQKLLAALGERLGWRVRRPAAVRPDLPLRWESGGETYAFYGLAAAAFSRIVQAERPGREVVILVYPGSRSALIAAKLAANPALATALQSVHLVKYRHLRRLAEDAALTPETFLAQLDLDPWTSHDPQMPLL